MVVAVTDTREVVLVKQYKHGLGRAVLDFPAGYLDTPDEDPLACAQRELREETGYESADWVALGHWCLDSNRSDTSVHFFLARHIQAVARPKLDETEALVHLTVPAHDLSGLFRSGDLPTVSGPAIWGLAQPYLFV
jgi:ADP-ribose pyrophosphatase